MASDATVRVVRLLLDGLVKRLESRHNGDRRFRICTSGLVDNCTMTRDANQTVDSAPSMGI